MNYIFKEEKKMRFRKNWVVLLFAITLMLVLGACGGGDNNAGENEGNSGDPDAGKKFTIFQSKVEISEELEALVEEYEEETGVEVEVWGTTGDDYFQQLQINLNSDQGPTIFDLEGVVQAEKVHSFLYDLSDESYVGDIAPDMELVYEDKIVGIPYGVEGFGIVYNKDIVNPDEITDFDSFANAVKELEGEGINPYGLSEDAYFLIGHMSNYPFSIQDDHFEFIDELTAGNVTMAETDAFQEFGQFMEVIRDHTKNPLEVTYDQAVGDFATGESAMLHQGNWAYGMFEDYDIDFEMGMMPFPLEGNDKLAVGVGSSWAINGTKDQAEIDAARDFLEWMFTSETGHHYIVEEFGFVPAMTTIEAEGLDPLSQDVLDASNSGETIPWSHAYYPANYIVNDLTPVAEEFFLEDSVTGEQFIENMENAFQNAID